jgi:hypothetical protein
MRSEAFLISLFPYSRAATRNLSLEHRSAKCEEGVGKPKRRIQGGTPLARFGYLFREGKVRPPGEGKAKKIRQIKTVNEQSKNKKSLMNDE